MGVTPLAPQASASASSATFAGELLPTLLPTPEGGGEVK